jgi:hypothetical protein
VSEEVRAAIMDFALNSWRLGMMMGSGSDYYEDGKLLTATDLQQMQKERLVRLEMLLARDES